MSGSPRPRGKHDRDYVRQVLDVALRIGSLLLSSNSGTADVTATMSAITASYGLRTTQLDVTASTIIVSVPRGVDGAPLTAMWRVRGRSLDYTRLHETLQLAQKVADERPDLAWVHAQIDGLETVPHPYPRWVSTVALGVMAASFSVLLGAGPIVAVIAAAAVSSYAPVRAAAAAGAAGALGALIYFGMMHLHAGNVASSFVAATAIGLAGAVVARRFRIPTLVIVRSGIVPLVPGVTLYRGFVTLVDGHATEAVGTLIIAAGTALALAAGVVFGPLLAPVARREIRHVRRLSTELGPRIDARWVRTPALAGIDLRHCHYARRPPDARPRREDGPAAGGPPPPLSGT